MSESLITDEARAMIGTETEAVTGYPVTEHEIRRYAYAADDHNPLWSDPEYAGSTEHGGIIAPPLFYNIPFATDYPLSALRPDGLPKPDKRSALALVPPLKATRQMAGETELEFFQPIRPGDVLSYKSRLADLYERDGRSGRLAFIVLETTCRNQRGEVVAKEKFTLIQR